MYTKFFYFSHFYQIFLLTDIRREVYNWGSEFVVPIEEKEVL